MLYLTSLLKWVGLGIGPGILVDLLTSRTGGSLSGTGFSAGIGSWIGSRIGFGLASESEQGLE